jgi:glycosyltransferase involved in cell wall biosynthesis
LTGPSEGGSYIMSAISVLYLITELNVGGAEKVVANLATQLSKRGHNVLVACLFDPGPIADEIIAAGVPVVNLGMRGKGDLRVVFRLLRLLRIEGIQVLHSHLFHANLLAPIVGRIANIPIIIATRHSADIYGRRREWVSSWVRRLCDAVVAVSEEVRDEELRSSHLPPSKMIVIPNGVEIQAHAQLDRTNIVALRGELGIPPNVPLIGTVASFKDYKGHTYLIDATVRILEQFPNAKVLFVGDGPLRTQLENKVEVLDLTDAIVFTGIRRDVRELLTLLDLFVLPSLSEALPVAVLEAMAAGRPVVATSVGGVPEAVVNGVTGLLVPPRNPTALAEAIVSLLSGPELRQQMGQAGRERVLQHFSVEQMVERTQTLYEQLLDAKGLRSAQG